jgi:hypothetical protein
MSATGETCDQAIWSLTREMPSAATVRRPRPHATPIDALASTNDTRDGNRPRILNTRLRQW